MKKIFGGAGAAACIFLLILVAARIIDWKVFWLGMILLGAIAYWVIPHLPESE